MDDPRALIDAYAAEKDWDYPMAFKPARRLFAPKAFAAVRAVLDLHKPETQLVWPDPGEPKDAPMLERLYCVECSHYEGAVGYPCETVEVITRALEVS